MSEHKSEFRPRDRWLMYATFIGPLAVLSNLTINYSLASTACQHGSKAMMHMVTLVAILVVLSGLFIGWRNYKRFEESESVLWMERTRWNSMLAMVLSIASVVVLIAMEIPNIVLGSCD